MQAERFPAAEYFRVQELGMSPSQHVTQPNRCTLMTARARKACLGSGFEIAKIALTPRGLSEHVADARIKDPETRNQPSSFQDLIVDHSAFLILSEGETFFVDEAWLTRAAPKVAAASVLTTDLAEREKAMIENALREAEGLVSGPAGAAAKLGVPRQTLESKIRKLGINRHLFKSS